MHRYAVSTFQPAMRSWSNTFNQTIIKDIPMTPDYSHMRMNDYKWIYHYIEVMGRTKFFELLYSRYKWLMSKPQGWTYYLPLSEKLDTDEEKDLMIKTVCLFISEGHGDYQFSENYTTIMRT